MGRATRLSAILLTTGMAIAAACSSKGDKAEGDGMPSNSFFLPPPQPPEASTPQRPKMNTESTFVVDPGGKELTPITQAVVMLYPTKDNKAGGVVRLTATNDGVRLKADLNGLTFLSKYQLNVHLAGDCSADGATSAGPPFNFMGSSLEPTDIRYGALGEVEGDVDGRAKGDARIDGVAIQGPFSILGRSVVLHGTPADPTKPAGAAGPSLACGVIGLFADPGGP
jgi:superoxide dismutase, Cu-Zn family